jgi:site-specific recombinase XerD
MTPRKLNTLTLAERYDQSLRYGRGKHVPAGTRKPLPTTHWHADNIHLLEKYERWLFGGGVSEMVICNYHIPMAGHVFGLTLKSHFELDLESDLSPALEYVEAKGVSATWRKNSRLALVKFRRFMRLERGLGEESHETPFDASHAASDLPVWLVHELEKYQRLQQRNWRTTRLEQNIRRFWSGYLRLWRFFVEQCHVQNLTDLKRKHVLEYIDQRLCKGYSATGVNHDLRDLRTLLLFLQDEEYSVPQSLLKIPNLKPPEPLPKYLTDDQICKLRDEIERGVHKETLHARRRLSVLIRAAFYLLWQGGMRLGEVEELRLEDLDFPQKRLSVRDGKGKKDRTVYLTETTVHALHEYLAMRGEGSGDHVFLYRNAPLRKDILRDNLKYAGERVGVKVYPHRLRHTCATQLLNAGCRVTSIQRFLGHKKLSSTMIYAKAHDQTVAEDYFSAMQKVEERLQIGEEKEEDKVVKVQMVFQLIQKLEMPELCFEERLGITSQLREALGNVNEHAPPEKELTSQK